MSKNKRIASDMKSDIKNKIYLLYWSGLKSFFKGKYNLKNIFPNE